MDRKADDNRTREREQLEQTKQENAQAMEHTPPVWVVDMRSHRVVRRRVPRRQGAVHSER